MTGFHGTSENPMPPSSTAIASTGDHDAALIDACRALPVGHRPVLEAGLDGDVARCAFISVVTRAVFKVKGNRLDVRAAKCTSMRLGAGACSSK